MREIALLGWVRGNANSQKLYEWLTAWRVAREVWRRVSDEEQLELLHQRTAYNIARYCQDHPHATSDEQARAIARELKAFQEAMEAL